MDLAMPGMSTKLLKRRVWPAVVTAMFVMAVPATVRAQVVVVANGSPITELDIQQRSKLIASGTHKAPSRQDVINELIDDRLKISKAKYYGLEVSSAEVDNAFANMASRQRISPEQFAQFLERSGVSAAALKARIRAELTWSQLVRGKFSTSLQVGDSDVAVALRSRNQADEAVGYIYTLYPIVMVVPRGAAQTALAGKLREAEQLRGRFTSCAEGLAMARRLREVAVREPINKSSADLPPQLAELLGKMEIGRVTVPEVTPQGLQMFALCAKKETSTDTAAKREVREELFTKRYEAESKKFLEEIRKSAMIEYKR
jgi:peptidyl-prolyl cis-trans isomerase SurA